MSADESYAFVVTLSTVSADVSFATKSKSPFVRMFAPSVPSVTGTISTLSR